MKSTVLKKETLTHTILLFPDISGCQNPVDIILFLVKKKKPRECFEKWQEPTKKTCRQGTLKMPVRSVTARCATCQLILFSFSLWEGVKWPNGLQCNVLGWIKSSRFNFSLGHCMEYLSVTVYTVSFSGCATNADCRLASRLALRLA